MSFLRNLVRRSAGLAPETPVRPPRGLPVFGPPAAEAATIESLDLERGPPAADAPAATTREARTGIPEPAERALPTVRTEARPERQAEIVILESRTPEPRPAAGVEPPAHPEPVPVPARKESRGTVEPMRAEAPPREDRAPEPRARVEVRSPLTVPASVEEDDRPEPEISRPAVLEAPEQASEAVVDQPVRPASPRAPEAGAEPPGPRAPEATPPADALRATTLAVPRERPTPRTAPQPRPAERPRITGPPATPPAEPPVEIRIGRIEVRAPGAPEPPPAPPPRPVERGFGDLALARRGLERRWY